MKSEPDQPDVPLLVGLQSSAPREELDRLLVAHGGQLSSLILPPCSNLLISGLHHHWSEVSLEFVIDHLPHLLHSIDENGDTPLHHAASEGILEACQLFLRRGASPNVKNKDGQTALHLALKTGRMEVVTSLLQFGADVSITWKDLDSLQLASLTDNQQLITLLKEHKATQRTSKTEEEKHTKSFVERVLLGQMSALIRTRTSTTSSSSVKKKKRHHQHNHPQHHQYSNSHPPTEPPESPRGGQLPGQGHGHGVGAAYVSASHPPSRGKGSGGFFKKTLQALFSGKSSAHSEQEVTRGSSLPTYKSPTKPDVSPLPLLPSQTVLSYSTPPFKNSDVQFHSTHQPFDPQRSVMSVSNTASQPFNVGNNNNGPLQFHSTTPQLPTSGGLPVNHLSRVCTQMSTLSLAPGLTEDEREALRSLEQVMDNEEPLESYSLDQLDDPKTHFLSTAVVNNHRKTSDEKSPTVNIPSFGVGIRFNVGERRMLIEDELGKGSTATVWKALIDDSVTVAIKAVSLVGVRNRKAFRVVLSTEVQMMMSFNHPNIIKYHGEYFLNKQQEIHVLLEYVNGGPISKWIKDRGVLSEKIAANITYQVLQGIAYLHKSSIIHRDIKPDNMLLSQKGTVKLIDFGVATKVLKTMRKTSVGTPWYTAPEVINAESYSYSADIWSVGCSVIEMVSGKPPYGDLNAVAALFKMVEASPPLPSGISPECSYFLKTSLLKSYSLRPTAIELLRDAWIVRQVHTTKLGLIRHSLVTHLAVTSSLPSSPRALLEEDDHDYDYNN